MGMSWFDCALISEFVDWLNNRFNLEDKEFPNESELIEHLKIYDEINCNPFSQKLDFRTNFARDILNAVELHIETNYMDNEG